LAKTTLTGSRICRRNLVEVVESVKTVETVKDLEAPKSLISRLNHAPRRAQNTRHGSEDGVVLSRFFSLRMVS